MVALQGCVTSDPRRNTDLSQLPPSLRSPASFYLPGEEPPAITAPTPALDVQTVALSSPTEFESLPGFNDWENEGFPGLEYIPASEQGAWDGCLVVQDQVGFNVGLTASGSSNPGHVRAGPPKIHFPHVSLKKIAGAVVHKVGPPSLWVTKQVLRGGHDLLYGGAKVLLIASVHLLKMHH